MISPTRFKPSCVLAQKRYHPTAVSRLGRTAVRAGPCLHVPLEKRHEDRKRGSRQSVAGTIELRFASVAWNHHYVAIASDRSIQFSQGRRAARSFQGPPWARGKKDLTVEVGHDVGRQIRASLGSSTRCAPISANASAGLRVARIEEREWGEASTRASD